MDTVYAFNQSCDDDSWLYKVLPFLRTRVEIQQGECFKGFILNACEAKYCEPNDDDDDIPQPSNVDGDDDQVPHPEPVDVDDDDGVPKPQPVDVDEDDEVPSNAQIVADK